jgi:hypothetical protein
MHPILSAVCVLITLPTPLLAQKPAIQGYHRGLVQLSYTGLYYNSVFNATGSKNQVFSNTSDVTAQLYAEYGIAKRWEIRGVLPYSFLRTRTSTNLAVNPGPAGTLTAVGNIGLGLRRSLLDGPVQLTVGVDALASTFTNNDRLGLRSGYEGWTVLPAVSVGHSSSRAYYGAEVGYGFMTKNYSDFLKLSSELGYRLHPRLWVAGTIDARLSARNGPFFNTEAYQFTGTYLNNQQYVRAGLKATYTLITNTLGVSGGLTGILAGQNIAVAQTYNAGIFIKW